MVFNRWDQRYSCHLNQLWSVFRDSKAGNTTVHYDVESHPGVISSLLPNTMLLLKIVTKLWCVFNCRICRYPGLPELRLIKAWLCYCFTWLDGMPVDPISRDRRMWPVCQILTLPTPQIKLAPNMFGSLWEETKATLSPGTELCNLENVNHVLFGRLEHKQSLHVNELQWFKYLIRSVMTNIAGDLKDLFIIICFLVGRMKYVACLQLTWCVSVVISISKIRKTTTLKCKSSSSSFQETRSSLVSFIGTCKRQSCCCPLF